MHRSGTSHGVGGSTQFWAGQTSFSPGTTHLLFFIHVQYFLFKTMWRAKMPRKWPQNPPQTCLPAVPSWTGQNLLRYNTTRKENLHQRRWWFAAVLEKEPLSCNSPPGNAPLTATSPTFGHFQVPGFSKLSLETGLSSYLSSSPGPLTGFQHKANKPAWPFQYLTRCSNTQAQAL